MTLPSAMTTSREPASSRQESVFISYSSHDRRFATELAKRLRATGFEPWLDEERIPASRPFEPAIREAMAKVDHAVLVVSEAYLQRDWPRYETWVLARRDPSFRRVVITRFPRGLHDLGPHLTHLPPVVWPDGDPSPDARFWQVYCGLKGAEPGPESQWAAQGERLLQELPRSRRELSDQEIRDRLFGGYVLGQDDRPLYCDRKLQWGELQPLISAVPGHKVIFLPGAEHQGHEFFLIRMYMRLPKDADSVVLPVSWKWTFPKTRVDSLGALALTLFQHEAPHAAVPPSDELIRTLPETLNRQLADKNIVLLHPCLRDDFGVEDRRPLVRYYTEWLPEVLERVGSGRNLVCVQPIEWPTAPLPFRIAATLIGHLFLAQLDWVRWARREQRAQELMRNVEAAAHRRLSVHELSKLSRIKEEDVEEFCKLVGIPKEERRAFINNVMRGSRTPVEIMTSISKWLPRFGENDEAG
jgi:hypothetical protein